jgi:hypothetical protein
MSPLPLPSDRNRMLSEVDKMSVLYSRSQVNTVDTVGTKAIHGVCPAVVDRFDIT